MTPTIPSSYLPDASVSAQDGLRERAEGDAPGDREGVKQGPQPGAIQRLQAARSALTGALEKRGVQHG